MINIRKMSYAGRRHIAEGKQCQDYAFSCSIKGVSAVALADGAGSASKASQGAMAAAKTVCVYMCENFDRIFDSENEDKEKFFIVEAVKYELEKNYQVENFEDFNSTFLCAAVSGDRCMVVHLGDGVVGRMNDADDSFFVMSAPMNGLTKRQTYLTGMKNAYMHLRLYKESSENIKALLLLTDGLASDVFDFSTAKQRDRVDAGMILSSECDGYFRNLYSGDDDYSYAVVRL